MNYGLALAVMTAAIVHVLLNNFPEFSRLFTSKDTIQNEDVHSKLMRKYKKVPNWWYIVLFTTTLAIALIVCESKEINLPWWGVLMAVSIAAILVFPYGIVAAITNVSLGVNVISEFIAGLIFPGMPLANVAFKTYGCTTLRQALWLTSDLKLGHYMKVPPRDMFIAQASGTFISGIVNLITTRYLIRTVPNICQKSAFPWTCPITNVFYSASIIWGLIGPVKMFGPDSIYNILLYGFLVGAVLPFIPWLLAKKYDKSLMLRHIHIPIFLMACSVLPPASAVVFPTWFIVAFIFNFVIYQRHHWWWLRYNYILSAALMTGTALCGVFIFYAFQLNHTTIKWWGTAKNFHCPLASKPLIPPIPRLN
ncbi:Oligopeptide transporter 5 [Smittium culicis]|uniref:Oligopeptide transporter 5 n=1 Tax=Smittium culicis TaxID=133412 RepID=A0A1R1YED5_9FUNG|nr:Oligopeptide transporter 5 [Smittium culicis]